MNQTSPLARDNHSLKHFMILEAEAFRAITLNPRFFHLMTLHVAQGTALPHKVVEDILDVFMQRTIHFANLTEEMST